MLYTLKPSIQLLAVVCLLVVISCVEKKKNKRIENLDPSHVNYYKEKLNRFQKSERENKLLGSLCADL